MMTDNVFTPLPERCTLEQLLDNSRGMVMPMSISKMWEDGYFGPIVDGMVDSKKALSSIRNTYIANIERKRTGQ
jgi:hypothetical protein